MSEVLKQVVVPFFNPGTLAGLLLALLIAVLVWGCATLYQGQSDLALVSRITEPILYGLARLPSKRLRDLTLRLWKRLYIHLRSAELLRVVRYSRDVSKRAWALRLLPNHFSVAKSYKVKAGTDCMREFLEVCATIETNRQSPRTLAKTAQDSRHKITREKANSSMR